MQRVRSSYHYALRSVAGSIFDMPPHYFAASCDRASIQQIMDMIGWVAGKGKEFDVLKAPIIYPDLMVNPKKAFGNWLVIAKVRWNALSDLRTFTHSFLVYQGCSGWKNVDLFEVGPQWRCKPLLQAVAPQGLHTWLDCMQCDFGMF